MNNENRSKCSCVALMSCSGVVINGSMAVKRGNTTKARCEGLLIDDGFGHNQSCNPCSGSFSYRTVPELTTLLRFARMQKPKSLHTVFIYLLEEFCKNIDRRNVQ